MNDAQRTKVRELNDKLRASIPLVPSGLGMVVMTSGIQALSVRGRWSAIHKVQTFSAFSEDNDPYGEHDFGSIELGDLKVFWKIDYYDKAMEYGSEEPWDVDKTCRVLTIMLAEEC